MSKKTNALKALAKQKKPARKPKQIGRRNPAALFPVSVAGLGLNLLLRTLFPPPAQPQLFLCRRCKVSVAQLRPTTGLLHFCPQCRGPLESASHIPEDWQPAPATNTPGLDSNYQSLNRFARSNSKTIDVASEDVTYKRLPAPEEKP